MCSYLDLDFRHVFKARPWFLVCLVGFISVVFVRVCIFLFFIFWMCVGAGGGGGGGLGGVIVSAPTFSMCRKSLKFVSA